MFASSVLVSKFPDNTLSIEEAGAGAESGVFLHPVNVALDKTPTSINLTTFFIFDFYLLSASKVGLQYYQTVRECSVNNYVIQIWHNIRIK